MVDPSVPILTKILLGTAAALYYVLILKKRVFGGVIVAVIMGIIGSVVLGLFLDQFFFILVNNFLTVNFVSSLFGAFILVWLFSLLSRFNHNMD